MSQSGRRRSFVSSTNTSANIKKAEKAKGVKKINYDIVTGKEVTSVFFDPSKSIDCTNSDYDWIGENLYAPACVVKEDNGILTVRLPNGEIYKVNDGCKVTDNDDEGVDDILKLRDFSEMSLVHTLRVRYHHDEIYTYVGPILISLNPYKPIKDIYSYEAMEKYHGSKQDINPPHLFVLAESAYSSLMVGSAAVGASGPPVATATSPPKAENQTIIISGESGSGKTEATKVIMSYLARITLMDTNAAAVAVAAADGGGGTSGGSSSSHMGELEQRVLNTNPVLEAFGNARTLRNDNSSRFGKFIKIQLCRSGRIAGATIEKYLLEKTRLIHQTTGERNYHIFYQLLQGAPPELLDALHLLPTASVPNRVESFAYLSSSASSSVIPHVSDADGFTITCDCMLSIGISSLLQRDIFRLLSGILHLGNVLFERNDSEDTVTGATPQTQSHLNLAATLLGIESADLLACMTCQNMYVGGSTIVKAQSFAQAVDKRNSFAKTVYSMLFSWLVDKINTTIAPSPTESLRGFIGLLDIYGFENFENLNSFEQLLINYANEKMQSHFNTHIFQIEQAEYESESIDWSYIEFKDNQACVELIDGKPNGKSGVFQSLDDSGSSGRQDINANFLTSLTQAWSGNSGSRHPHYVAPRFNSDKRFGVLHYAGEVFYEVSGFAEKNRDSTNQDMKELMAKAEGNALLKQITEETMRSEAMAQATIAANAMTPGRPNSRSTSRKRGSISSSSSSSSNVVAASAGSSQQQVDASAAAAGPGATSSASTDRASITSSSGSSRGSFVSKLKEDSISKQFTNSLKLLFSTLEATEPHFVRCVKPNIYKQADCMNAQETLLQLKNAGMMETIRIRQQGYALRLLHKDFFFKYSRLVPTCQTLQALVDELSDILSVSAESWQVGTNKIFIRRDMCEKLDRLLWLRYSTSSCVLQRFWRNILTDRAAIRLQAHAFAFLARRRYARALRGILLIQTVFRMHRSVQLYRSFMHAIVTIQRLALGKIARIRARRLRNPYNRMSYQELTATMRKAQEDMITAFAAQDFALCSELENAIADIVAARSRLPLPDAVPSSRAEVELYVVETGFAMVDAEAKGDEAAITALEVRMQTLQAFRAQYPTKEELESKLDATRQKLATAMERKQFKECGQLQQEVTLLESKLAVASSVSEFEALSVADLKSKSTGLEKQIADALAAKDFDLCSSLQTELDSIQEILVRKDISKERAEARKAELEQEMSTARGYNDYLLMAELLVRLNEIKTILAPPPPPPPISSAADEDDPAGDKTSATTAVAEAAQQAHMSAPAPTYTRAELIELITEKESSIKSALQAKNYSACDALNVELEALQEQLASLPTAATVKQQLTLLEGELAQLISTKQYSKCPAVEKQIEELKPLHERLCIEETAERQAKAPKVMVAASRTSSSTGSGKVLQPVNVSSVSAKSSSRVVLPQQQNNGLLVDKENQENVYHRPVSKLRPKPPITALETENILQVAKKMANSRVDAALLLDSAGALAGILTDNDVTRRVVSQFLDPSGALVQTVMTKQPKCVHASDSALDALEMMVDNRFRHLPVLDAEGSVVGLLDIAKCLYDAISVLEKVHGDEGSKGDNTGAVMAQAMTTAMLQAGAGGGKGNNQAQLQALQSLMEQMFGGAIPTLRRVLSARGNGRMPMVRHTTNVREATAIMAECRIGLLVVDEEEDLVGILTPKDVLNRVVAVGKSPDVTAVSSVMTPNPDCVDADITVLDALRDMHDHKYLHLPVREMSSGKVLGIVDVMQLICSTADDGSGAGKGWREFFNGAMNARGDDGDISETISTGSRSTKSGVPIKAAGKHGGGDATSDAYYPASTTGGGTTIAGAAGGGGGVVEGDDIARLFDFKVTDHTGHLYKIKCVADSLAVLRTAVANKLHVEPVEHLLLKYTDEEGDELVVSSDAILREAVEFARCTGNLSLKLRALVDPFAAKRTITNSGNAVNNNPKNNLNMGKAVEMSKPSWLMIGGAAMVTVVAIAAVVIVRKNN